MEKNKKISNSLKKHFTENGHHSTGKEGWRHSDADKELKRQKTIEYFNRIGRKTEAHKKARNKANVYAYRARMRNAIPEDADLKLIRLIYENCPEGYHVDHIQALANGGLHHQDNLQYLEISENCRKGKNLGFDPSKSLDWRGFI